MSTVEKPVVDKPGDGDRVPQPLDIKNEFYKYLLSNPLKIVSSLVFTTGALFIGIHFFRIQYVPELTLDSLMPLAAMVAILGMFILLTVFTVIVAPAAVYINLAIHGLIAKPDHATMHVDSDGNKMTFFSEMLIAIAAATVSAIIYGWLLMHHSSAATIVFISSFGCSFLVNIALDASSRARCWMQKAPKISAYIIITLAYLTFCPILVLVFIESLRSSAMGFVTASIFLLIAAIMVHFAVYLSHGMPWKRRVIGLSGITILLIVGTSLSGNIPQQLASTLGYGMMSDAELVVDHEACKAIKLKLLTAECDETALSDKRYVLKGAFVLSKLGDAYLISDALDRDAETYRIEIPKEHVKVFTRVSSKHSRNVPDGAREISLKAI
jgi:hypothetical protein